MVQIRNLTLTDATFTLDYQVSNPFEDGIWVCYDRWVHGEQGVQDVATRIDGETVWIKLLFNLAKRTASFVNPPAIAKYVRLSPGESCSGRILLDLPIRGYSREGREGRKERKQIILHRAILEVGYLRTFGPKWTKILDSRAEKLRKEGIKPKPIVDGPYYILPVDPLITEEALDGQLREVMYLHYKSFVDKEESAEVLITDVDISCSVVVDDE